MTHRACLFALTALLLVAPTVHAEDPGYVLVADEVFASGLTEEHAKRRLLEDRREMLAHLNVGSSAKQESHVVISHMSEPTRVEPTQVAEGLPLVRLRSVVRCVVWVADAWLPPRAVLAYRRKLDVELNAPAAIVIQAGDQRTSVNCELREGVRVGWAPLEGTREEIRARGWVMGLDRLDPTPERERVLGLVLRATWRSVLGRPGVPADAKPKLFLRIGRWHLPISDERAKRLLGDEDPVTALSVEEARTLDQAFQIMFDAETEEELRKDLWRLRRASPPFKPDGRAARLMRQLLDLPEADFEGMLDIFGD